jgi:hypothetical protein
VPGFENLRDALNEADKRAATAREDARTTQIRAAASRDRGLAEEADAARRTAAEAAGLRAQAVGAFAAFADPRENVGRLDDRAPVLLLPLRLETRFSNTGPDGGAAPAQLLVRIFPDACSVDAFDEKLSAAEVDAATRFWRESWRAGGVEVGSRAAWAGLAGAFGAGRATWIVEAFAPRNPGDKPATDPATEIVLVLAGSQLAPAAQRPAIAVYWSSAWRANGNPAALSAARVALAAALGGDTAAAEAIEKNAPFNLGDPPPQNRTHGTATVVVAWLELPDENGEERLGWRRAPMAAALPERFVVLAYSGSGVPLTVVGNPVAEPLYLGPDPAAPPDEQILPVDGKLTIPPSLEWMFSFDAAVTAGMGIRVPLTTEQAAFGFDRILVLGIRLRDDAAAGQATLQELIRGHRFSRAGFEVLAQGVATNNSEDATAAHARRADPDLAYDDVFGAEKFVHERNPLDKRDGQILAERLGLDASAFQHIRGADGRDTAEAQAMNTALAPGTIGYMAGTLMSPVFESWADELVWFFGSQVKGRGILPAIRIGNQPYGILASTAYSRISWLSESRGLSLVATDRRVHFLRKLHRVLMDIEGSWRTASATVAHVGAAGDPHQILLDILGLHPTSAEYHIRHAKSLDELSSRAWLGGFGKIPTQKALALKQRQATLNLLRQLGYADAEIPDILDLFFKSTQLDLKGPLIEGLPLSETSPLAASTTDGRNYLAWLAAAAGSSLETLRQQTGFVGDSPPPDLLYLMLHFALVRGFQDAGDRLRRESGHFDGPAMRLLRREPKSVHLVPSATISDSPWRRLYDADARLTGSPELSIAAFIIDNLERRPSYAVNLADQIRAVRLLATSPTARLERVLAEHIDAVSYRFDVWRLGLVGWQLDRMRRIDDDDGNDDQDDHEDGHEDGKGSGPRQGVYLGAYGLVENLRPKPLLSAPTLPADLAQAFAEGPPLVHDPTNGGHLHAPSLNQAVTAAILRAGEMANRVPGSTSAFSINLSSARVRSAMALLDGIRSGQNLGALLGYTFERALHDVGGNVELDVLVFAFRRAFPLTADRLKPTQDPPPPASEAIEARNVVDGLALVKAASAPGSAGYPYGKTLPAIGQAQRIAVEKAVTDLQAVFDALADLTLAESVHQSAQGNAERAAAHLDVAGTFQAPPDPDVIRTPDRGYALTCRVGLELDAAAVATAGDTPRATAQPAVNAWLADALPPLGTIACRVVWQAPGAGEQHRTVTLADLGVAPIDAISLLVDLGGSGSAELDDRIRRAVVNAVSPRPDRQLTLRYLEAGPGQLSVFTASALAKRLRALVLQSRPLRAGDVALPGQAASVDAVDHVVRRVRIADVVTQLGGLQTRLNTAISAGAALLADPVANRTTMLTDIDTRLELVVERLAETAAFGGAQIGWGSLYDWRGERFHAMLSRVTDLLLVWQARHARCVGALDEEAGLPPGATADERITLLRTAEAEVSTALATALDPAGLRAAVAAKLNAFTAKAGSIQSTVLDPTDPRLADRLARCRAILPLSDFDAGPPDFTDIEDSVVAYWTDLQHLAETAGADVAKRVAAGTAALAAHDAAPDAATRLSALQEAAEAVFGEGFTLVPTFALPPDASAEQGQAHTAFTSGALLAHAASELDDAFPLDSWLYGAARVRPAVRTLEDAIMLWDAHGLNPGQLFALQLPHRAGAPWLGLDFPKQHAPTGESLAYVAYARPGHNPTALRCGLLLDDWSEIIPAIDADEPGPQHTTAAAINFDRPGQEPPQTMMLLTPAQWDGVWSWDDIVHGVLDTLELARIRTVEPAHLDATAFAQFLPATVASVTTSGLSISANYALANMQLRYLRTT